MNPIVRQIVNRAHVSWSNRVVIRTVIEGLRNKYQTWRTLPRDTRRAIMRDAIACHGANRDEYAFVMRGRRTRERWRVK